MLKSITGFLIGENSRKREIGLFFAFLIMFAEALGWITPELAESLIPFVGLWLGVAWTARVSKMHKAMKEPTTIVHNP